MLAQKSATYLDLNAGRPLHSEAVRAIQETLSLAEKGVGLNPSSLHHSGRTSKQMLNRARASVRSSLSSNSSSQVEVVFTSSCTEANQMAVRAFFENSESSGASRYWLTSRVEHECHLSLVDPLENEGVRVTCLGVDREGGLDFLALGKELTRIHSECAENKTTPAVLLSLLWINNETGVVLDLPRLKEVLSSFSGVMLHLDGAQAWGKVPVEFEDTGADFLGLSGHKVGAPSGVGVLAFSERARKILEKAPLFQGKQEFGIRAGTENLLGIVALGAVAAKLTPASIREQAHLTSVLRDSFERELLQTISGLEITGSSGHRVSGTTHFVIPGVRGDMLAARLDLEGFQVSTGSACRSGSAEPSHVLLAMGRSPEEARSCLRVSFDSSVVSAESLSRCAQAVSAYVGAVKRGSSK